MAKARTWGATPEGWTHFKRLAPADLLPVVSNPGAEISPRSKMKALGKTPSLYVDTKDGRRVIGFTDWTDHFARPVNIDTWSREPDYGICLQTWPMSSRPASWSFSASRTPRPASGRTAASA